MSDSDLQLTFGADAGGLAQGVGQARAAIASLAPAVTAAQASLDRFAQSAARAFAPPNVSGFSSAASQVTAATAGISVSVSGAAGAIRMLGGGAAAAAQQTAPLAQGLTASRASVDAAGAALLQFGAHAQVAATATASVSLSFTAGQSSIAALNGVVAGAGAAMAPMSTVVSRLASTLGQLLQQTSPVGGALSAVSGAAQSIAGVFSGVGSAISGVANVFNSVAGAVHSVSGVFNGVGQAISGVANIFNSVAGAVQSVGGVFDSVSSAISSVSGVAQSISGTFQSIGSAVSGVSDVIGSFNGLLTSLTDLVKGGADALKGGKVALVAFDAAADANPVGLIAQAVQLLVGWITKLIDWLKQIGALGDAWDGVKAGGSLFGDLLKIVWDTLVNVKTALVDVLTGHWSFDNLQAGFNQLAADIRKTTEDTIRLGKAAEEVAKKAAANIAGGGSGGAAAGGGGAPATTCPPIPKGGGGGGGKSVSGGSANSAATGMEKYQADLVQKEDQVRASTGAWLADLTQMDLDYWNGILAHAKLSAKDRAEVEHTVAELNEKINGEKQTDVLDQDKARIEADKGNVAALTADWQKYTRDMVKAYGFSATQVIAQQREMVAEIKEANSDVAEAAIRNEASQVDAIKKGVDEELSTIKAANDAAVDALKAKYDAGQISAAQYYTQLAALQRDAAAQEAAAIQAGVEAQRAATVTLLADANLSAEQRNTIIAAEVADDNAAAAKIKAIWDQLYKALGADRAQQLAKFKQQWDQTIGSLTQTFAQGLLKMAQGGESFSQLMRGIGQKILTDWVNNIARMVSDWARGIAAQVLATAAGEGAKNKAKEVGSAQGLAIDGLASLKSIVNDAATAASGAYQATVKAIPPPLGPVLGAGAAAAALAAVMAFRGMVSSAAGGFDIPAGINPLTQLHAQEMVLPARLANPMRDMLASYSSGGAPAAGGHSFSFGETHIHGAPNMSPSDFKSALAEHRSNVAEAVAGALRGGWRPSYKQPVGAL
jgi:phage-related protein